jgi:hypothetical protein
MGSRTCIVCEQALKIPNFAHRESNGPESVGLVSVGHGIAMMKVRKVRKVRKVKKERKEMREGPA